MDIITYPLLGLKLNQFSKWGPRHLNSLHLTADQSHRLIGTMSDNSTLEPGALKQAGT